VNVEIKHELPMGKSTVFSFRNGDLRLTINDGEGVSILTLGREDVARLRDFLASVEHLQIMEQP
jgi:hypothetical protein